MTVHSYAYMWVMEKKQGLECVEPEISLWKILNHAAHMENIFDKHL